MTVICFLFPTDVDIQTLGEVFYRYTPQLAWRGRRALFLEVSQCQKIYTAEGIVRRGLVYLQQLGLKARVAMAESVPAALSLAIYRKSNIRELPIECLRFFALPFQVNEVVEKNVESILVHLKNLNIKTLGDFQEMRTESLLSRFGSVGWLLAQNTREGASFVWPRFAPADVVAESVEFDFEFPVESVEPILFHLKSLLDKIYLRLRGQGLRMKQLLLKLDLEHGGKTYELSLIFTNGILAPKNIFQIVREQMDHEVRRRPLSQRVSAFHIEVKETTPYRQSQRDLFSPKKQEEEEEYSSLISRLRARLGQEAVFSVTPVQSFVPEFNWAKSASGPVEKESTSSRLLSASKPSAFSTGSPDASREYVPFRPLRIFRSPLKTVPLGEFIYWEGQKIFLGNSASREVVLSEWWNDVPERIYFRASTKAGQDLWLFRSREGVFIHGFFD